MAKKRDKNNSLGYLLFFGALSLFVGNALWQGLNQERRLAAEQKLPKPITHEPRVWVKYPISQSRIMLEHALKQPGEQTVDIDYKSMIFSPVNGMLRISGQIRLPEDLIKKYLPYIKLGESLKKIKFQLGFIPRVEINKSDGETYLTLSIENLKIAEEEFSSLLQLAEPFVASALSDERLLSFVEGRDAQSKTSMQKTSLELRIKDYLAEKNIETFVLNGKVHVRLKLNVNKFLDFSKTDMDPENQKYVRELQVWHFGPTLFKGTNEACFLLVVGTGRPSDDWLASLQAGLAEDRRQAIANLADDYAKHTQHQRIQEEFVRTLSAVQKQKKLGNLDNRELVRLQEFQKSLNEHVAWRMSKENRMFEADPTREFSIMQADLNKSIEMFFDQIVQDRRAFAKVHDPKDLVVSEAWTFLDERVSQKTISSVVRHLRDYEYQGARLFQDLNVTLHPEMPGIVITGRIDRTVESLTPAKQSVGLSKAQLDALPSHFPFELHAKLLMQANGSLRVDIRKLCVRIGMPTPGKTQESYATAVPCDKAKGVVLDSRESFGKPILKDIGEKIIQNVLAGITFNLMGGKLDIGKYIKHQDDAFLIEVNPFLKSLPLSEMKLSESANFPSAAKDIYLWNLEPVYSDGLKRNYLDISLGIGPRSTKYSNQLKIRPEAKDSQIRREESSKPPNNIDLHLSMDLKEFSKRLNKIMEPVMHGMNQQLQDAIREEKQGFFFKLDSIGVGTEKNSNGEFIKVTMEGELRVFQKRNFSLNPKSFFSLKNWPANLMLKFQLHALANLTVEKINHRWAQLEKRGYKNIHFGSDILKIDFEEFGVHLPQNLENLKALRFIREHVDYEKIKLKKADRNDYVQQIMDLVREKLMERLATIFDDFEGNRKLGEFPLNRYARVYFAEDEILIQLNPRMLSPAFDVSLISNETLLNGKKVGLKIKPQFNRISLDFQTDSGFAKSDKLDFAEIMAKAKEIFAPYLGAKTREDLLRLLNQGRLYEEVFRSNDPDHPSLLGRLHYVLKHYPEIKLAVQEEHDPRPGAAKDSSKHLSECGVELVHFMQVNMAIFQQLHLLHKKMRSFAIVNEARPELSSESVWNKAMDIFYGRVDLLARIYTEKFHIKNRDIVAGPKNDWSSAFYEDAVFAMNVYRQVETEMTQFARDVKANRH